MDDFVGNGDRMDDVYAEDEERSAGRLLDRGATSHGIPHMKYLINYNGLCANKYVATRCVVSKA